MAKSFGLIIFIVSFSLAISAQSSKKPRKPKVQPKKPAAVKTEEPLPPPAPAPPKANQRADNDSESIAQKKNSRVEPQKAPEPKPVYFYEFSQPQFNISKINLEHDEDGKGKITFIKRDFGDPITDPVELSKISMEKIKALFQALDFLNSSEVYQTERSYAHMGVMKIAIKKEDKQREVTFDWTNNKDAKALADEYRKIADQYIWIFDITLAKENQPLEAPKLMELMERMFDRGEISDPLQMIPIIKELSNDERIPLIGRNRAKKIIEKFEKGKK